jgi:glutathione S-transferase
MVMVIVRLLLGQNHQRGTCDSRIRWALEEVGQPYKVRFVSFRAMKEPAYLALHSFRSDSDL